MTDESVSKAEHGPDLRGAGYLCAHSLQMEEEMAVAGLGGLPPPRQMPCLGIHVVRLFKKGFPVQADFRRIIKNHIYPGSTFLDKIGKFCSSQR